LPGCVGVCRAAAGIEGASGKEARCSGGLGAVQFAIGRYFFDRILQAWQAFRRDRRPTGKRKVMFLGEAASETNAKQRFPRIRSSFMAKVGRKKKSPARAAKASPATRKRRVGRPAKAVDPVLALREHRANLEALLDETRNVQEATLKGVARLVESTVAHARLASEQILAEIEKLDEHCRKLKEKHGESVSEEHES
jgi:hypothetical protein